MLSMLRGLVGVVTAPLAVLNSFGLLVSGIWLALEGRWSVILDGGVAMLVGWVGLPVALGLGDGISTAGLRLMESGHRLGGAVLGMMAMLYAVVVGGAWNALVLFVVVLPSRVSATLEVAPILMWGYGVATVRVLGLARQQLLAGGEYGSPDLAIFMQLSFVVLGGAFLSTGRGGFAAATGAASMLACWFVYSVVALVSTSGRASGWRGASGDEAVAPEAVAPEAVAPSGFDGQPVASLRGRGRGVGRVAVLLGGALVVGVVLAIGLHARSPKTYDDCILERMQPGMNQLAIVAITKACRSKYGSASAGRSTVDDGVLAQATASGSGGNLDRPLNVEELGKITVDCRADFGRSVPVLYGAILNGNEDTLVTRLEISARTEGAPTHRVDAIIKPRSAASFAVDLVSGESVSDQCLVLSAMGARMWR